jgi:hypothetical protein
MLLRKDKGQTRDCTVESIVQEVRVPGGGADSDILVFQGNDPNANPNPPRLRKSTTKNKSWRNNFHGSGYEFFFCLADEHDGERSDVMQSTIRVS